jgi:glycosyltransferase involved in cell wall biosynthesis
MKEQPLVSIIISSYNYGRFLGKAIDSALQQTYAHTEVIVVDDGSMDDSPQIIRACGEAITAVIKENGGQASAFNAGFSRSKGEIIIFLDSDDMLMPKTVEKAVEAFENLNVVKTHWQLWKIDASGNKMNELDPKYPLAKGDLLCDIVQYGPNHCGGPPHSPPTSGIAWSRNFLNQVFPIPEKEFRTCTDQYLFLLAPVYGYLQSLEEPLGFYRVHGDNYSLNPIDKYIPESIKRFEQCCHILNQHLIKKGIDVEPSLWVRDTWYHKINFFLENIESVVPPAGNFVLVDGNQLGTSKTIAGRNCIPFMEKQGQYWGSPADDLEAIREIERQRANGATHIIFAWLAFWLLDYYQGMHHYLRSNHNCVIENECLIGFDLQ